MKKIAQPIFVALACGLGVTAGRAVSTDRSHDVQIRALAEAPLCFEANRGQAGSAAQFIARGHDCAVFIAPTEASLLVSKSGVANTVRLTLNGANSRAAVSGVNELPGHANYFIGSDSSQWRSGIPLFSRVRIEQVYPGVDLIYYADQSARLEYDFLLQPGADPKPISLCISGADKVRLDADGNLILKIGDDEIRQHKPVIYQTIGGVRKEIAGGYKLAGKSTATFWLGEYDRALPLVIDPTVTFSGYLAGKNSDAGWDVATDTNGYVYVCGDTLTAGIATAGTAQRNYGGTRGTGQFGDAFVAKYVPDGDGIPQLSYLTYLGGVGQDAARAVCADGTGNAYVTGFTDSPDFPTHNALRKKITGLNNTAQGLYRSDAFVTKISPDGKQLIYSTYLGGEERDGGNAIAVDAEGHAYVAGFTESLFFRLFLDLGANAKKVVQKSFAGVMDAFVAKLGTTGSTLEFSTFLGGSSQDCAQGIALDTNGNACITGYTLSSDFPVVPANNSRLNGPAGGTTAFDAFFTKISANGATNIFSCYLGGRNTDVGMRIAVQGDSAYLTGYTYSKDFPTNEIVENTLSWAGASSDVFVTKFSPPIIISTTNTLITFTTNVIEGISTNIVEDISTNVTYFTNSTYFKDYSVKFGSKGPDQPFGIAVDDLGEACIAGFTTRTNFYGPLNPLVRTNFSDENNMFADFRSTNKINSTSQEAFVALLSPDGSKFQFAALFGGKGTDAAHGIALDSQANAYVVGGTTSFDFPTTNSIPRPGGKSGKSDVFLMKMSLKPFQEGP